MTQRSRLIVHNLNQTAVYWGTPTNAGQGRRTFATPVDISVRWDVKQELFINDLGQEVHSEAVVRLDQDVDLGGYLYLGSLDDLSSSPVPDDVGNDAKEIRGYRKIPNRRGDVFFRKVFL